MATPTCAFCKLQHQHQHEHQWDVGYKAAPLPELTLVRARNKTLMKVVVLLLLVVQWCSNHLLNDCLTTPSSLSLPLLLPLSLSLPVRRRRHTASINYKVKLKLNSTTNNASCCCQRCQLASNWSWAGLAGLCCVFRLDLSCLSLPLLPIYIYSIYLYSISMLAATNAARSLCLSLSLPSALLPAKWRPSLLANGGHSLSCRGHFCAAQRVQLPTETNHCDTFIKMLLSDLLLLLLLSFFSSLSSFVLLILNVINDIATGASIICTPSECYQMQFNWTMLFAFVIVLAASSTSPCYPLGLLQLSLSLSLPLPCGGSTLIIHGTVGAVNLIHL